RGRAHRDTRQLADQSLTSGDRIHAGWSRAKHPCHGTIHRLSVTLSIVYITSIRKQFLQLLLVTSIVYISDKSKASSLREIERATTGFNQSSIISAL
uniref:Uncharacterized protein n=1 Tax=Aegilops tauschii subsp. strangulata TaxID=200361 RepID=A0A453GLN9_AEGTS